MSTSSLFPWMAVAFLAHGAAFAAANRPPPAAAWSGPPLEVELAPAALPEPPAAAAPELPDEARSSDPVPALPPSAKTVKRSIVLPAAAPAKVGALLTSGETADSSDPVAFLSDPNGGAYGSGVVAHGGQAEHGLGPTVAASVGPQSQRLGSEDGVTPATNLSHAPSLDEPDACRGFFPAEAAVDAGRVDLVVIVQAEGRVTRVTVARESPAGEGFGQAARACLLSKRFTPGADRAGRAVTASAAVRVHFTR